MNTSNASPVTLWIFKMELLNEAKAQQTHNVNTLSFVSKLTTKAPYACVAGDIVSLPDKGWRRVLELLTYSNPDAPQRVRCTTQMDPAAQEFSSHEETLPAGVIHCITRVPPAQVQHDDVLVLGSPGARYYARVDGIDYHSDTWHTKPRPVK